MLFVYIFILLLFYQCAQTLIKHPLSKTIDKKMAVKMIIQIIIAAIFINSIQNLFLLEKRSKVIINIFAIFTFIIVIHNFLYYLNCRNEFDDISKLMLRMCIHFRIHQKLSPMLSEIGQDLSSDIKRKVEKIQQKMNQDSDGYELLEITSHYLMNSLIQVFIASEQIGNQHTDQQLYRLEEDIEMWIHQTFQYQFEEVKYIKRTYLLIFMSIGIAYFAQSMLIKSINISYISTYQNLIIYFFCGIFYCCIKVSNRFTYEWILKDECL